VEACVSDGKHLHALDVLRLDSDVHIGVGYESYAEADAFSTKEKMLALADHFAFRRLFRFRGGSKRILHQKRGMGFQADDHDTGMNNLVDDLTTTNNQIASDGLAYELTAGEWETAKANMVAATAAYQIGNTQNNDAEAEANPLYFRFTCGNIEVFVISCLFSTESPDSLRGVANTSNPVGPMLPDGQKDWLYARLAASTKPFKLILSQKAISYNQLVNADSFKGYTDGEIIKQWIHDNSATFAVPGGVAWACGDWHSPGMFGYVAGENDATYDHLSMVCDPAGRGTVLDTGDAIPQSLYHIRPSRIGNPKLQCFGVIETADDDSYMDLSIVSIVGKVTRRVRLLAGENKPYLPTLKISAA
jgi:hypothetical protein